MPGIEKHRDICALGFLAEFQQPLGHRVTGEVDAFDDVETDLAKQGRHRFRIERRIGK